MKNHLRPKIYRCHCGRTREEYEDISLEERNIDNAHNLDNIHVEEVARISIWKGKKLTHTFSYYWEETKSKGLNYITRLRFRSCSYSRGVATEFHLGTRAVLKNSDLLRF